ncbi:magnesium ion transporter [Serendipita sp. 399]|nr:magnesium ion transporter [Serendipita sp. 399]
MFLRPTHGPSNIQARDLRKIDSRIPNLVPTILVRKEAFLVNVLHIRALIKADAVLLFDTYGSADSRLHSTFLYHLEASPNRLYRSPVDLTPQIA